MQELLSRHVLADESSRLGVESGWYITKVSGTFVSGPLASKAACTKYIADLTPKPTKRV